MHTARVTTANPKAPRTVTVLLVAAVVLPVLAACAASGNPAADPGGQGFWWGLWHGAILPVTFIVSLFNDGVGIYEVDNNGGWYDFGFLLGLALFSAPILAGRRR